MATTFEFISASDKPALLAFSTPEWLEAAKTALTELGYKVHTEFEQGLYQTYRHLNESKPSAEQQDRVGEIAGKSQ